VDSCKKAPGGCGRGAPAPDRPTVLIVADVGLYRDGLERTLNQRERIRVIAGGPCQGAIYAVSDKDPDVVLVDMAMTDGLTTIRALAHAAPDAKVVALALLDSDSHVISCAEAGALAYVRRDATIKELEDTIESVARGETPCPPRIAASLFRHLAEMASQRDPSALDNTLTSREIEIAHLLDEGLSNKQIADRLCIALPTVKNHVHSILDKLSLRHRSEVASRMRSQDSCVAGSD
jgi:two-component system nitrate/nitrite response regulator NarL